MSIFTRPRYRPPIRRADRALDTVSWLFVAASGIWVALNWQAQAHIVLYANTAGGRGSQVFLLAIMAALNWILAALGGAPANFTYPIPVTAANAPRLYPQAQRLMRWFRVLLMASFAAILALSVLNDEGHNVLIYFSVPVILILIMLAYGRIALRRMRAAPDA